VFQDLDSVDTGHEVPIGCPVAFALAGINAPFTDRIASPLPSLVVHVAPAHGLGGPVTPLPVDYDFAGHSLVLTAVTLPCLRFQATGVAVTPVPCIVDLTVTQGLYRLCALFSVSLYFAERAGFVLHVDALGASVTLPAQQVRAAVPVCVRLLMAVIFSTFRLLPGTRLERSKFLTLHPLLVVSLAVTAGLMDVIAVLETAAPRIAHSWHPP
jgi:hypothetical protein